jgi:predicted dienelactone hydrolase
MSFREEIMMALRRFLSFASAAGLAAALATAVPAAASTAPLQLTLPAPTGPDPIGTVSLHLVQNGRPDPWVPGRTRELMVSLWYPARHAGRYPTAPYMTPGAWASLVHNQGFPASVVVPQTDGHDGAPVDRLPGGLPVVLYSPPSTGDRSANTTLVEDLASRGYLVATIDHTYSDDEVEFPGGRVAQRVLPADETRQQFTDEVAERDKDTRFVLDELTAIDHGKNPDADHHRLPGGLRGALDLNRVGMFGHSLGGATAAATMLDDSRIKAGIDMDGTLLGPVVSAGLTRPFLLLSNETHNRDNDSSWAQFWNASTGWKRDFRLLGSQHLTYSDAEVIFPQTAPVMGLTPAQLAAIIGTIDPPRAITVESTYVDAFFDLNLRHHDEHLLDGPSPQFPEMLFQP